MTAEGERLRAAKEGHEAWKQWGPYLSERQWGTVREDYSESGDPWNHFTHDQARSRAFRNGEDGLAGISDDQLRLCFALALWNGHDPILKERLFGLTNEEGNHGEDVKEYYFYLDSTPTHSYMRFLYKYPARAYPYLDLVQANMSRSRTEREYELLDTGIFDEDRYCDVFVEYAKAAPDDILVRITVCNRGPEQAGLYLLPTLWFRNTWSWSGDGVKPCLRAGRRRGPYGIEARFPNTPETHHTPLPNYILRCQEPCELLFTENETNCELLSGTQNASPYVKDAFHRYLIDGETQAVNPHQVGTKACALYRLDIAPGDQTVVKLRLTAAAKVRRVSGLGSGFDRIFDERLAEADAFFKTVTPKGISEERALIVRQALAGMMWSKQFYHFDVGRWLRENGAHPGNGKKHFFRNRKWFHMINNHIISMPDKWEYPWYAAWDLAFQAVALSQVDMDFAKEQLSLMLDVDYLHPSGQLPAYEWNFSDVNPPVHAWATLFVYRVELYMRGRGDLHFLKHAVNKLLLNFTWWVNRKDRDGRNVFEGGFLGLDNIGVFDRSRELPTGGHLEQADGTAWMALFCQNMIILSAELAMHDTSYVTVVHKFLEHFLWIAWGMNRQGRHSMWDEEDGFYYDLLRLPDGGSQRLKVRSMVGLLPLCATSIIGAREREHVPQLNDMVQRRLQRMPELLHTMHPFGPGHRGVADRDVLALVNRERLCRILSRMLDENEFLSAYGIRALSRAHLDQPYVFCMDGGEYQVGYVPGESDNGMFGGNSNWRGPIWMPVNLLIIRSLLQFHRYYGDSLKVECPTGSGVMMDLFEVSQEISNRLIRIFERGPDGQRPLYGDAEKFQTDPLWGDHLLFYEYFHGDDGSGLGASHQTGWTGIVAKLIQFFGNVTSSQWLQAEFGAMHTRGD